MNIICYALQKNKVYLFWGIIFAFIISVSIVIIVCLKRKLKQKGLEYNEEINTLKKERDELQLESLDYDQKCAEIEEQVNILEHDMELYNNKCNYYARMDSVNQRILYALKNRRNSESGEVQTLISEIEYIFRDDTFLRNAKMNSSIFVQKEDGNYCILASTRHSTGTIRKLELNEKSLVGATFKNRKVIYCGDLDNRRADFPFVELEGDRKYHSILAIPCCLDDKVEFVLVVTCTKQGCLEETYKKYQDIIHRYLELIGIMMFIKFGKETE